MDRRRRLTILTVVVLGVWQAGVLAAAVAVVAVDHRVDRVDVSFPIDSEGDTWLVVGLDSRTGDLPEVVRATTGSEHDYPGQRADVILVVHRTGSQTGVVSIPRDLLVNDGNGWFGRAALSVTESVQILVDGLCNSVGIAADHLVMIDIAGFIDIVDATGSVEVAIDHPTRDPAAGLDIQQTGTLAVDSATALAIIRSRHTEQKRAAPSSPTDHEAWVTVEDGAELRSRWAADVFSEIAANTARRLRNPATAPRVVWTAAGNVTVDADTRLIDLLSLAGHGRPASTLETDAVEGTLARTLSPRADAQLTSLGFTDRCDTGR